MAVPYFMGKSALRAWKTTTLVIVAGCAALLGCRSKAGGDCTRTECAEGLSCYEAVCRPTAEVEAIRADRERAKICKTTCVTDGLCGAMHGKCIATGDADCRKSLACEHNGACSVLNGACAVVSDDDCKRGWPCTRQGKCHASKGECTLAPGICRERPECKEHGLCAEKGDACIASTDADCEASSQCQRTAECTAEGGKCVVADDEDCARSNWCASFANCKKGPGPGGCMRDAKRFPESEACRRYGCCGQGAGDRCQARSEADCKKSVVCEKHGMCFVRMGACVRSCKDTVDCRTFGLCTDGPGSTCIAGSDADCASSRYCRESATCTAGGGKCVATDASCAAHRICRETGRCGVIKGVCTPTTPEHCKQSEGCSKAAWCRLEGGSCKGER